MCSSKIRFSFEVASRRFAWYLCGGVASVFSSCTLTVVGVKGVAWDSWLNVLIAISELAAPCMAVINL
jgi:hypothetical protein